MILIERPEAEVSARHFRLEQRTLAAPGPDEALLRALYLSIEPLLRGRLLAAASYASPVAIGACMTGRALCEVLRCDSGDLRAGDLVECWFGWRDFGVIPIDALRPVARGPYADSLTLSLFGASGLSAYLALARVGSLQAGQALVVTAAAGAVGALAVQFGKRLGARVIGIAGGADKTAYVCEELGADAALDYKAEPDLASALRHLAPNGVDVFLDSVGGKTHDAVMANMAQHGRVIIFGTMDYYSDPSRPDYGKRWLRDILVKRLIVKGFLLQDYADCFDEARAAILRWWEAGDVLCREDIRDNLENAPRALADVIAGRNKGKVLIRLP